MQSLNVTRVGSGDGSGSGSGFGFGNGNGSGSGNGNGYGFGSGSGSGDGSGSGSGDGDEDIEGALQLITGMFIDINIAYAEIHGSDGDGEKRIDITGPYGQRKVTIHSAHL